MAITIDELKRNVFPGESGGDYNALFGYANRPGGQFASVNLTDMSVDQALQFADPSGPYAASVRGQVGRTATPMGAYQVVGTTLRGAKEGLGLTGQERMTPQLQDAIGMWIYQNQGPGAWEAWGGGGGNVRKSSKGTGMGLLDMPAQQPRTLMDRIRSPETTDNLLAWVNSMRTNPDPNIGTMIENRQARRAEGEAMNRTAQWLRSQGREDLAGAIESGILGGKEAASLFYQPAEKPEIREVNGKLVSISSDGTITELYGQPPAAEAQSAIAKLESDRRNGLISDEQYQAGLQALAPQGMTIESDGAGGFRMVQGAGVGGKPATEGQLAGAGYLQRMTAAESILRDIETQANVVAIPLEKTLLLGTKLEGYALDPTEQRVAQAQRDWVRAKLRKESGAVIGPEEMAAEIQTYFPLPGESQETIAQKAESRRRAERQMQIGSGSAAEQAGTISPSYSAPIRMDELVRKGVAPASSAGGGAGATIRYDENGVRIQ